MNYGIFDTHQFVKRLTDQGMSEPQAETIVNIVRDSREHDMGSVATKGDLRETKAELKIEIQGVRTEIQEVKAELKAEIQEVRNETQAFRAEFKSDMKELELRLDNKIQSVIIKLGSMIVALGGVLIAIKFFG